MAEIGGLDLGKKIGPFPLGIWIVAVAGGLGIAYVVNRGMLSGGGGDTSAGGTTIESGIGGTPGGFVPAPQPGEETEGGILDNEMWAFQATTWLVVNGYSAIKAGTAVRKYLDAEKLSAEEATMIDAVIKKSGLGPPPQIPVGGGIIPTTPAPTTPKVPGAIPALAARAITRNTIQLSWERAPGAVTYEIQRRAGGGLPASIIVVWQGTSYTNTRHLKPNTAYTFQVRGVSPGGKGPWKAVTVRTER